MKARCKLELSNGEHFEGIHIGAPVVSTGELVFTTAMVGYGEALTDPSYFGQILLFAYPLVGNYGLPDSVNGTFPHGFESHKIHAAGVVIAVDSEDAFHWSAVRSFDAWLKHQNLPGIAGVDTRALVQRIRNSTQLLGRIVPEKTTGRRFAVESNETAGLTADKFFDPGTLNVLPYVSSQRSTVHGEGKPRIALVDCGVKWNITRELLSHGCSVEVVPWNADLTKIKCDGWLISNGPGNPQNCPELIANLGALLKQESKHEKPILGICLGHQLLALAAGAKTQRMPYGHRSHNQPVYEVGARRGFMSSQNHGYVVVDNSIPSDWETWFLNANDGSIEGIKHKTRPFRSVQFHPEASPGPQDTNWIIKDFIKEVTKRCL